MFGFGKLGSYDYFGHVSRSLVAYFEAHGRRATTHTIEVAPTASIRRRATTLVETVSRICNADTSGDIHFVGHSTGGLDVRLVASPSAHLPVDAAQTRWLSRLRSVTTLNAPHYGTPLASFFATVSGQRMLYALSALTIVALTLGTPPLAAASAIMVALGLGGRSGGGASVDASVVTRTTDAILKVFDSSMSGEVREYLRAINEDQGAVIQLTPEAMDLFQAGVENRPDVHYQCTASMAPPPSAGRWARLLVRPWTLVSSTLFATLQQLTSRYDERYPCAAPFAGDQNEGRLVRSFGRSPGARANDGVVPLRSQIWGEVAWCGYADHLDVLGHFEETGADALHIDWMKSGSSFDRVRFAELMTAIGEGMLRRTG
jgi:triacylglycerol esterase/lipase EstA (alpha/beta hydrolase family)